MIGYNIESTIKKIIWGTPTSKQIKQFTIKDYKIYAKTNKLTLSIILTKIIKITKVIIPSSDTLTKLYRGIFLLIQQQSCW